MDGIQRDAAGGNSEFGIVPTDGRKHDPNEAIEATNMCCAI